LTKIEHEIQKKRQDKRLLSVTSAVDDIDGVSPQANNHGMMKREKSRRQAVQEETSSSGGESNS